jgi:quercetin dioxygenase-like cupin family protein
MSTRDPSASGPTAWRTGRLNSPEPPVVGERFDPIVALRSVDIEQITSSATPDPTTYDQAQDEWVLVLEGRATLDVDGSTVTLAAGDWLLLPARTHHRVIETAAGTRWLAIHIHPVE